MKRLTLILAAALVLAPMCLGLGQRTAVQYIRQIAANLNLTAAQCEALTKEQAATYILNNYPSIPVAKLKEAADFWPSIKVMLVNDAKARLMASRLVTLRQRLLTAYPQAQIDDERARELATALLPYLYGEAQ